MVILCFNIIKIELLYLEDKVKWMIFLVEDKFMEILKFLIYGQNVEKMLIFNQIQKDIDPFLHEEIMLLQ